MIKRNFETIKCVLDLMIIFAPFILLFDNGLKMFLLIFYLIYLPSLIFSVIELKYRKKDILFKRSIPIKGHFNKNLNPKQKTVDYITINK
jgi:hypothetical protein